MVRAFRLLVLITITAIAACGQEKPAHRATKPFHPKEYPAEKFQVTKNDYAFGDLTVRVIDVKNRGGIASSEPHFCSAWVEVLKSTQLLKRFYYGDIEPVGANYGAFVPKQQPSDDYFAVVKEGDYDGRLLLIDHEGKVVDLPGGFYFVTPDKKLLFSLYSSDSPGLAVFDLANHHVVLQPKDLLDPDKWYHDSKGYFFTDPDNPGSASRPDFRNHRFVSFKVSDSDLKKAIRVDYDFDPRKKKDCTSVRQ